MLKSAIKTAFRTFRKDKGFTAINIFGLSMGIAFSLLTFAVVTYELSFDQFHKDVDRLYRINSISIRQGTENEIPATPFPLAEAAKSDIPAIEEITKIWFDRQGSVVVKGDEEQNRFEMDNNSAAVDASFFDIFDFPIVVGDVNAAEKPNVVFISERLARRFFGDLPYEEILGKVLEYNEESSFSVAGIFQNSPSNTDIQLDFVYSTATFADDPDVNIWPRIDFGMQTFVKLTEGTDVKEFLTQLEEVVTVKAGERFSQFFKNELQPLSELHFDTSVGGLSRTISKQTLYIFALIGIVILVTACINFVNLSTANAARRAKEIGIKKILGNSRSSLLAGLLIETALITCCAAFLGVIFAYLFYPYLVEIIGFEPPFSILMLQNLLFLVFTILFIIAASGIYPAFVTSAFQPVEVIKQGLSSQKGSGLTVRRILVVLQFSISQALIICTLVVSFQLDYFLSKDLGFSKDEIINIQLPQQQEDQYERFTNALTSLPFVEQYSVANGAPSSGNVWMHGFSFEGANPDEQHVAHGKYADEHYLETFGMELLAGRNYLPSDTLREVVVNEMFIAEMGILDPRDAIGKTVNVGGGQVPIVGVAKDWHLVSLREPIQPSFIGMEKANFFEVNVKLAEDHSGEDLEQIGAAWNTAFPNAPFEYEYLNQQLAQNYEQEQRLSNLFKVFAFIALSIGCLGLVGLVSFMVNQKLKEVGIRKVLGASTSQIMYLFSVEFVVLVAIAFMIGAPISYYYMQQWLASFSYSISLGGGIFALAAIVSILVAIFTVSYQSFKASHLNPSSILRNE